MFPIVEKLGGLNAFLDLVERQSAHRRRPRPSKHALKKWKGDGRLPSRVVEIAANECKRIGIVFDPDDCRARIDAPPLGRETCVSPFSAAQASRLVAANDGRNG